MAEPGYRPVSRSVPQRSVLGPSFSIYLLLITRMKGKTAPSAGLQMMKNWEEWLIHHHGVLPVSGTWAGQRAGQRGVSSKLNRGK